MMIRTMRPVARALGAVSILSLALGAADARSTEAPSFEDAATMSASAVLPPELMRGPHHEVADQVTSDGLIRTFSVESEFGTFPARGEHMVRIRIREIEALEKLRERAATEAFQDAEASVPDSPYVSRGAGWVADPDAAPAGLGVGSLGGSWSGASGAEGGDESGDDPDAIQSWKLLMGFETRKRQIAESLGVDPFTTNPALQKALDRHAWVSFQSGEAAPEGAAALAGPAPGEVAAGEERLQGFSSQDLNLLNRMELVAMGVPEELREEFISNPSYSHKVTTTLVESLAALEGTEDRVAFIEAAVNAQSAEEAQSFGELAKLMRSYSSEGGGLSRILQVEGQVAAYTSDGTLIVPVVSDHAVWTERVAGFAESVAKAAGESPDAAKARFLFSGSLSDRALEEIQSLGIDVTPNALGERGRNGENEPEAP